MSHARFNSLPVCVPTSPSSNLSPYARDQASLFWFANSWFNDFDAATLYGLLRYLKPRHYVELGCGFSSLISSRALSRNAGEASPCDAVFADPSPRVSIT